MTGCSVLRIRCPDALLQESGELQDREQQLLITTYRGTSRQYASQNPSASGAGACNRAKRSRLQSPHPDFQPLHGSGFGGFVSTP